MIQSIRLQGNRLKISPGSVGVVITWSRARLDLIHVKGLGADAEKEDQKSAKTAQPLSLGTRYTVVEEKRSKDLPDIYNAAPCAMYGPT